ncbi:hypothetical protein C0992_005322, partial [Termitomyces sp. T32_za158]
RKIVPCTHLLRHYMNPHEHQSSQASSETQFTGSLGNTDSTVKSGKRPAREFIPEEESSGMNGSSSQSTQTDPTQPPIVAQLTRQDRAITEQLEGNLDSFRRGRTSKADAITKIISLVSESGLDKKIKRGTITSYILLLGEIEEKEGDRERRARLRDRTVGENPENRQGDTSAGSSSQTQLADRTETHNISKPEQSAATREQRNELARAGVDSYNNSRGNCSDSGESSGSEQHRPKAKKRKVIEEDLPWYQGEKVARESEDA